MQRIEENKYEMFKAVEAVLDKNQTAVDTLPALADAKGEFASLIAGILKADKDYGTATVGKVAVKNSVENKQNLTKLLIPTLSGWFPQRGKVKINQITINNSKELLCNGSRKTSTKCLKR